MCGHHPNKRSEKYLFEPENVIYAHDLSGNVTFLNRQGEQLLGYTCEEARSLNIAEIVAPEIAGRIREQMLSSTTKRIGSVYELEMIAKDGRRVPVEVSTSIVFRQDQPPEIEGIVIPATPDEAPDAIRPRCLDTDFCYRIEPS